MLPIVVKLIKFDDLRLRTKLNVKHNVEMICYRSHNVMQLHLLTLITL